MNNLDKFRHSYDDPSQLNITLKKPEFLLGFFFVYARSTNDKNF